MACHSFPPENSGSICSGNIISKKSILFIPKTTSGTKSSSVPLEKLWSNDGEDESGEASITILHPEMKPKGSFLCCNDSWHFSSLICYKGKNTPVFLFYTHTKSTTLTVWEFSNTTKKFSCSQRTPITCLTD